jgi:hypothetical protein
MRVSSRNRLRYRRKHQATPTDHANFNEFLGAQAEAKAFEVGGRMLEAALAKYDTDPDFGDLQLGKVLSTSIEALNKKS